MSVNAKLVQSIFIEAVGCENIVERKAIVDRECADNPELRRRVDALLLAHEQTDNELDQAEGSAF